jgi:hypothetical protein
MTGEREPPDGERSCGTQAPENWFREPAWYAAELYALEKGVALDTVHRIWVKVKSGAVIRFDVTLRSAVNATVRLVL